MYRSRVVSSIGLTFFVAACSSSSPNSQTQGNGGSSGSAQTGGGAGTTSAAGAPDADAGAGASVGGGAGAAADLPDVVTSADGAFWQTGTLTPVTEGTADVTVDDSDVKQRWDGFGGTFNEAGWDALAVLSPSDRQLALRYLFDAANGANFAYGRLPIGASDYALARYTLDDSPNDYTMANFSIDHDKLLLIPYIKAALAIKPDIHLWASPWTPPAWMKDSNSVDGGNMLDDPQILAAYALYLEKYVQGYAAEGLTVEAIHPQNEPGYGLAYPTCLWTADLYIKFVRDYLGPRFAQDNVPAQIWCGTMSAQADTPIAKGLIQDPTAMAYVKGFGLQWEVKKLIPSLTPTSLPVMQTEHKCGNYFFNTPYWDVSRFDPDKPQNDYAYGIESWLNIRDWINAGVNSYSAWNMVLDTLGANLDAMMPWHQNALLTVDRDKKTLIVTPAYYVFRHLSQFVAPMATVIGVTGGDAVAFKNPDGALVVVMYNSGDAKQAIVSLGGTKVQVDLPANGWATIHHMK